MGKTHPHYLFGTMNRQKILLAAGSVALASVLILALSFPRAGGRPYPNSQSAFSSPQPEQKFLDSATSIPNKDDLAEEADVGVNLTASIAEPSVGASDSYTKEVDQNLASGQNSRSPEDTAREPSETELDTDEAYLPLVFFDYAQALPAGEEVAAAVQRLQQDFIDSTGVGVADPADPDYAQRWESAQPSTDEIFHAIAGDEAYNAASIMRVRQRGGF